MIKKCTGCLWEDQCAEEEACEYFDDGSEQPESERIQLREDFIQQWYQYVPREGQKFFEE